MAVAHLPVRVRLHPAQLIRIVQVDFASDLEGFKFTQRNIIPGQRLRQGIDADGA